MEMQQKIELQMYELNKKDFVRCPGGLQKLIGMFGEVTAQTMKDEEKMVAAGYSAEKITLNRAMLEMLVLSHGARLVDIPENSAEKEEYNSLLEQIKNDCKMMRLVFSHVIDVTDDSKLRKIYQSLSSGSSAVDCATDSVAMSKVLENHPQLICQIRPMSVLVDIAFLHSARNRAVELLSRRGFVVENGLPPSEAVDRQSRIVTLCMKELANIRKFANAAFYDNAEHYHRYYSVKSKRNDSSSETDENEPEEQVEQKLTVEQ